MNYLDQILQVVLKVELKNEKKILSVNSPLQFKNLCKDGLVLLITDQQDEELLEFDLEKDCDICIPIDMLNKFLEIREESKRQRIENKFVLNKIMNIHDKQCFQIQLANNLYYILQINKMNAGLGQTIVEIKPTFRIQNLIGIDIEFSLNNKKYRLAN